MVVGCWLSGFGKKTGLTNLSGWYRLDCMKTTTHCERGIIVGITGGIACGKTTVSDLLAEKGGIPINADEIGHVNSSKRIARLLMN